MDLYFHLPALLRLAVLIPHDGLEEGAFGELAVTGVFWFFRLIALGALGVVLLVEVGIDEVAFEILGVDGGDAGSLVLHVEI